MKKSLFGLVATLIIFSCKKEAVEPIKVPQASRAEIPYTGVWKRQFEAGPGNLHTVNYFVYKDSIRYTLSGPVGNANYVMHRDTFLTKDNRFIGHTPDDVYYLIFFKNLSTDSITLYKQTVTTVSEGLDVKVPVATTTQNHGWNNYAKQ